VIFEAEDSPGIACVSRSRLVHATHIYASHVYLSIPNKERAFRRRLKATVPCLKFYGSALSS
jgi:hypothetical protein